MTFNMVRIIEFHSVLYLILLILILHTNKLSGSKDDSNAKKWLEEAEQFCKQSCPHCSDRTDCHMDYLNLKHKYLQPSNKQEQLKKDQKRVDFGSIKNELMNKDEVLSNCRAMCPKCSETDCLDMFLEGVDYGAEHKNEFNENDGKNPNKETINKAKMETEGICQKRFPNINPTVCMAMLVTGVAAGGGAFAVLAAPWILVSMGFAATGIVAKSLAAMLMSIAMKYGVGMGLIAVLQSAGAASVGTVTVLFGALLGGVATMFGLN